MKLLINGGAQDLNPAADETLLHTVRELGLTGTKEGCASGDCGACTVLVGRCADGKINYKTVNACIAPTGQYAGTNVITVEGLARHSDDADIDLHPAQQAMVDCHGSQCGYCTPGFVMSLAALVEQGARADRTSVLEGISGNLCRCTGYRPIVEAGVAALNAAAFDSAGSDYESCLAPAAAYADLLEPGTSGIARPTTEAELQQALAVQPVRPLIAGGTDYMLEVTQRFTAITEMIDVSSIATLKTLGETDEVITIGAALSYTDLEDWAFHQSKPLYDLLLRLGSRQIRNNGTIGGNLANGSPIADMPPALIALSARMELVASNGDVRWLAVEDFYEGYRQTQLRRDEYIARIEIPRSSLGNFHRFYKSSKRIEDDISSVMGAFRFVLDAGKVSDAAIAFGGMAATPVRLQPLEAAITGQPLSAALTREAADLLRGLLQPMTDVRASASYRMDMACVMLERALLALGGDERELITGVELHA